MLPTSVILFISLKGQGRLSRAISIGAQLRVPSTHPNEDGVGGGIRKKRGF